MVFFCAAKIPEQPRVGALVHVSGTRWIWCPRPESGRGVFSIGAQLTQQLDDAPVSAPEVVAAGLARRVRQPLTSAAPEPARSEVHGLHGFMAPRARPPWAMATKPAGRPSHRQSRLARRRVVWGGPPVGQDGPTWVTQVGYAGLPLPHDARCVGGQKPFVVAPADVHRQRRLLDGLTGHPSSCPAVRSRAVSAQRAPLLKLRFT